MSYVPGADRDLATLIGTHLFVVCPNNSGSSFLTAALECCRATWRLPREGQMIRGFAGPVTYRALGGPRGEQWFPGLLWASERSWLDRFTQPSSYDWPLIRKAWYFHARAHAPDASVFVTKSTQHLLHAEQLVRHFPNARFLFMVRNPYAVCEGICRRYRTRLPPHYQRQFETPGRSLPAAAATHVANCLAWQRRNVETHRERGVFFTYETMCADPAGAARTIRTLVPELDDLILRRRLKAKDYDEMLTDMNERQIARLDAAQIAAFNRVFREHRDTLGYFGYELMDCPDTFERQRVV